MWISLLINASMSLISYHVCWRLIPNMKERFIKADMAGKDLNKPAETKKLIPEGLGAVCGCVFLMVMFLFIPIPSFITMATLDNQFVHLLCALLSICCMILLGFADDVLDLQWRHKLLLPTMASLPLLTVYFASGGLTSVLLPWPFRSESRQMIELSVLYYCYMALLAVFCTNAINILAGINGVEVGQSVVIATSIIVFNMVELTGDNWQQHLLSLYIIFPFTAVSMALLYHNWYPSEVFVGDTYCYFAGMTFAVVAILGHFSKTLLLFFIPQIFNFLYSTPQLFGILPCPRHRLPRYDNKTDLLNTSCASYNPSTVHPVVMTTLRIINRLKLVHIEVITNGIEERINNLTIINLVINITGPIREPNLTTVIITLQVLCSIVAFFIRYGVARFFYPS